MKRIPRREKPDRQPPVQHAQPARLFRVYPDPSRPTFVVEVRISRTPKHMRAEINRFQGHAGGKESFRDTAGLVRSYYNRITGRQVTRPAAGGRVVARMFLNLHDLRKRPSELVAHECTHAGMAWARYCKANLGVMPGEEVLCYAVGKLVRQVNAACYAHHVWP